MGTTKERDTPAGDLAAELRAELPESLDCLSDEHVSRLVEQIRSARQRQRVELVDATESALGVIPWPLRGAVKKAMGL